MTRTTLSLQDDALSAAKQYAQRRGKTLSQAVSELVLKATRREFRTDDIGGFHVVRLTPDSPKVTASHVKELEEQTF